MSDVTFKKGKDGYVAEFNAPGNILMQIYGEKQGRLTVYQYIDGMPPAVIDTINFTNNLLPLNLIAGLKVRLESDVEVKQCKYLQKSEAGESEPYVLPEASDSVLGGIKLGFAQSGKKYPVAVEGGKAYVEVPWTDNNTTYAAANKTTLGLVKQAAFVADATGQTDAHTQINAMKQSLVAAGIMASS